MSEEAEISAEKREPLPDDIVEVTFKMTRVARDEAIAACCWGRGYADLVKQLGDKAPSPGEFTINQVIGFLMGLAKSKREVDARDAAAKQARKKFDEDAATWQVAASVKDPAE